MALFYKEKKMAQIGNKEIEKIKSDIERDMQPSISIQK